MLLQFPTATAAATLLVLVASVGGANAAASDSTPSKEREHFSLTIAPARFVVPPRTGELHRVVTASNTGRTALDVSVVLSGFFQDRSGAVAFDEPGRLSEASWIKTRPDAFRLVPGGERKVRLDVAVPDNAEPGDHSIGLVFLVPSNQSNENLTLNRGIGVQMLVQAPGPVVHDVSVSALSAPWLSTGGSVDIGLEVHNSGTVHRDFSAPSEVVVARAGDQRLKFPRFTILAGADRSLATSWSDPPWICHCELSVSIPNGHGGLSVVRTSLWIFPIWQALGLLLLALGVFLLVHSRRGRHRAALAAARQEGYAAATSPAG